MAKFKVRVKPQLPVNVAQTAQNQPPDFDGFVNVTVTILDNAAVPAVKFTKTGLMVIQAKPSVIDVPAANIPATGTIRVEIGTSIKGQGLALDETSPVGPQEGLFSFHFCPMNEILSDPTNIASARTTVSRFKSETPGAEDYAIIFDNPIVGSAIPDVDIYVCPIAPEDFDSSNPVDAFTKAKALLGKLTGAMDAWANVTPANPNPTPADAQLALKKLKKSLGVLRKETTSGQGFSKAELELPLDQQTVIPVDILCVTCNSMFNTPGTAYYHNVTWYNNCLSNPHCQ